MSTTVSRQSDIEERAQQIEKVCEEWRGTLATTGGQISRSLKMGEVIARVNELITSEMVEAIAQLMNSPLGFKTDKDPATAKPGTTVVPYGHDVIKRVWVQAELMGARMAGNEINIIAGNAYRTKEHWVRLVMEVPGLSDLEVSPGLPKPNGGFGEIHVACSYRLDGTPYKYSCAAWIRLNEGWTISNVHGKATRYALQRLYAKLTRGTSIPDREDVGNDRVVEAEFRQVDPREAEADRQAAIDAAKAHRNAEGPQEGELSGPELAAEFKARFEAAGTLLELDAMEDELRAACNDSRLRGDVMSATWKMFRDLQKKLRR